MKTFFCIFLMLLSIYGSAFSSPQTSWSTGVITTNDNSLLQGEVSYNYAHDIVMFRKSAEATVKTFSARDIASFRYYDEQQKVVHYYKTFTSQYGEFAPRLGFFEIVVSGDVSYLRKHNRMAYYDGTDERHFAVKKSARISPHLLCYDYYVLLEDEIIRAKRFKKEVLPWLMEQNIAISDHMKENRLSPSFIDHQIQLVQYANKQLTLRTSNPQFSASIQP
ncbi:MAG: hypothetical protein AAF992_00840 [Bacteroidota bacterium]